MSCLAKAPGSILGFEKAPLIIQDARRAAKLEELRNLIGKKMATKFKTVRQCFHFIDVEHKGKIVREDIHRLFKNLHLHRNFGDTDFSFADDFYDLLNIDGNEEIDYHELQAFVGPYIHPGHCPILVSSRDTERHEETHYLKGKFHPIEQHENVKNMYATSYDGFLTDRSTPQVPSGLLPGYGGFVPRAPPGKPRTKEHDHPLFRKLRSRCSDISDCSTKASTEPSLPWVGTPRDTSSLCTSRSNSVAPANWPPINQEHMLRRLNDAALQAGSTTLARFRSPSAGLPSMLSARRASQ